MAKDFKIEIDRKVLEGLEKRLQDLNQKEIQYGYFDKTYEAPDRRAGIPVAEIAYKNEIGFITESGRHVPPRPFFTFSVKKAEQIVKWFAADIYKLTFIGKREKTLVTIGKWLKDGVQQSIDEAESNGFPPLSQYTINHKGSDKQLRETDTLYDSVEAKIVNTDAYGNRKKEVNI